MYINAFRRLLASKFRVSYAQVGEDVVISQVLKRTPSIYIDLGANHPAFGNNTYYFYLRGGRGVCVDPNIEFAPLYKKWRPGDTFICAAVSGAQTATVPFVKSGGHTGWHVSSGGDARIIDEAGLGSFDICLCSGLLYRMHSPVDLLARI